MRPDNHSVFLADSSTPIHAGAQPFLLPGGSVGILLIHGYGGSIGDFRALASELHAQGYTAAGLCLAGHGQTPEALKDTHLSDWQQSVAEAVQELQQRCKKIVLVGGSFGGILAVDFSLAHPNEIAAVVTINSGLRYRGAGVLQKPILHLLRLMSPYRKKHFATPEAKAETLAIGSLDRWPIAGILEHYQLIEKSIRPNLSRLSPPLLTIIGTDDPVVEYLSARDLFNRAGSAHKKIWEYPGVIHNPFRHSDVRAHITQQIQAFLRELE